MPTAYEALTWEQNVCGLYRALTNMSLESNVASPSDGTVEKFPREVRVVANRVLRV